MAGFSEQVARKVPQANHPNSPSRASRDVVRGGHPPHLPDLRSWSAPLAWRSPPSGRSAHRARAGARRRAHARNIGPPPVALRTQGHGGVGRAEGLRSDRARPAECERARAMPEVRSGVLSSGTKKVAAIFGDCRHRDAASAFARNHSVVVRNIACPLNTPPMQKHSRHQSLFRGC